MSAYFFHWVRRWRLTQRSRSAAPACKADKKTPRTHHCARACQSLSIRFQGLETRIILIGQRILRTGMQMFVTTVPLCSSSCLLLLIPYSISKSLQGCCCYWRGAHLGMFRSLSNSLRLRSNVCWKKDSLLKGNTDDNSLRHHKK